MSVFNRLRSFFRSDWAVAALCLGLFFLTNRYIYGWDDQHLEIPLLKHLIDPSLYAGDYYVQSLKLNFTSFLYPLLAQVIRVEWIPSVYLGLYIFARYFMFFFIFRLWKHISGHTPAALAATLGLFLLFRPEEFIYRTFSHQEFAYIFVFAGFYLFYRGRFLWAAFVYGLGANFHALYVLFPMAYLSFYLLFFNPEKRWHKLATSVGLFLAAASPFVLWTLWRAVTIRTGHASDYYENWIELYHLSCPQNFIFGTKTLSEATQSVQTFFADTFRYFFLGALFLFNWRFNDVFRKDHKVHALAIVATILILTNFIFTYIFPSHFILDLNLVRNEQYISLFLGGYTLVLACQQRFHGWYSGILMGIMVLFLGGKSPADAGIIMAFGIGMELIYKKKLFSLWLIIFILLSFLLLYAADWQGYSLVKLSRVAWTIGVLAVLTVIYYFLKRPEHKDLLKNFIVYPALLVALIGYCSLHYTFFQISTHGGGFWQLQRNWEEMQIYVRDNTPENAIILAPNDMEMGGFRIHSNRHVVVCYRDCGIIGFDYDATLQWRDRMSDTEEFKVIIDKPFTKALLKGVSKYGATHIVFMRYASPPENPFLRKMHENDAFTLYQVMR